MRNYDSHYESLMNQEKTKDSRVSGRWNKRKIVITFGFSLLFVYCSLHFVKNTRTSAEISSSTTEDVKVFDESDSNGLSPRVILMLGCSGSTTVNNFLYKVLRDHGIVIHDFRYKSEKMEYANFEMLTERNIPAHIRDEVNEWYKSLDVTRPDPKTKIIEELRRLNEELSEQNEVLMVKTATRDMEYITAFQDRFDASFTSIYRSNMLDVLICFIKDCFSWEVMDSLGYMTFENGTRADVCDERRKDEFKSLKLSVHLETKVLIDHIQKLELQNQERIDISTPLVYPSKPQTSEDLFAYEFTSDEDTFQMSLNAWIMALRPLVTTVQPEILESRMRPTQSTRSHPNYSDEIENYLEVYSALEKAGKLHFLRL